ncbi:D-lyxose/D-mannose family sugar isomerase [Desulfosediminicola flagellatus]|uniref:D-lyxose/D-mannose family sugar isomerase n=1 Tax=Desulfosediminicola flagellatus TaxID=2569541 RepID=UPI0010ACE8CB|nr:D-lyxose/D-mannose family sugar isomerase [Desulfosediminicola flagellatus]
MKRSEINTYIKEAKALFDSISFKLPPFGFWSAEDWNTKGHEADEIRINQLGWDLTDYGEDDYENMGLLLFTIRNGNYHRRDTYPKGYAEKIMIIKENQICPMHFHWKKREDIINRGGGNLVLELYKADDNEALSDLTFTVSVDGVTRECKPGDKVILTPGESICLEPYVYHRFYGESGKGTVIVGEVSDVNDDDNDNRFITPLKRFPKIIEDESPVHLLCNEYPAAE